MRVVMSRSLLYGDPEFIATNEIARKTVLPYFSDGYLNLKNGINLKRAVLPSFRFV